MEVLWNRLDSSDDRKIKTWLKNASMNIFCVLERLYVCTDVHIYKWICTSCVYIYMQYKFCVDGEWRHDELQPHSTTEYGIVNIVQFNMEVNFNPEMIPGSSMELDNEAFTRLVRYILLRSSWLLEIVFCFMNVILVIQKLRFVLTDCQLYALER